MHMLTATLERTMNEQKTEMMLTAIWVAAAVRVAAVVAAATAGASAAKRKQ